MEVNGVGVVTAAGWGFPDLVAAIERCVTCIGPISAFPTTALRSDLGGEVPAVDPAMPAADRLRAFARAALLEAVTTARLTDAAVDSSRVALVVGTTQGTGWRDGPPPLGFLSDPFHDLASEFGIGGPCLVVSTACTASAHAIALGFDLLDDEEVDIAIVGGADALCLATYAGFSSMRSLDSVACAPYTRSTGLTIGEGSGFLVMERPGAAAERGCTPIAHILGHGSSADCYHPTSPDPSGRAAARAMVHALGAADIPPGSVGYVNGHGTGTRANDAMEARAMELVFRDRKDRVPLSSIKSMLGHTLGAAGVIEVAACIASLQGACLPANVQIEPGAQRGRSIPVTRRYVWSSRASASAPSRSRCR